MSAVKYDEAILEIEHYHGESDAIDTVLEDLISAKVAKSLIDMVVEAIQYNWSLDEVLDEIPDEVKETLRGSNQPGSAI